MTTPLFIGESVPLEVRNIINSLSVGARVRYRNIEGFIDFICDDYITICCNEYEHGDPSARRPTIKCCLLVYNQWWDELEIDDTYFQYKKAYNGVVNDHPGNELLPELEKR
ncbi:hypothetical protein SSZBM1_38 [Synechococcus phage S-SZBM1]|uniref:Uncharacterized protein n=1 Tax=Synechococcus phage S-SZBM1 TaxID=2926475 RepID=A0AC61TSE5_9CAUD|nr:hypothetical protein PP650_gp038 [Synechococcus phage S-SZBM1]UNH61155.1 hypothetical protein SSZBM1_38 [Synechococcus phage S-SZBM1]